MGLEHRGAEPRAEIVVNAVIPWLILVFFAASMLVLGVYGVHLYFLVYLFRRRRKPVHERQERVIREAEAWAPQRWPMVTTQIPLFNERHVARRVIESAAAMDYPRGRHELQVLDDSTDGTCAVVDALAAELRAKGVDVHVIRRPDRVAYKAGALSHGLETARGEFVAMFDADFIPPADFLRRTVPLLLAAPDVACVQGRWAHVNATESWLTRAQALALDVHFAIEQGARAWNGLMMNFNGTAGIWRKAAINDPAVGGWSGDTLVEDMDLSYRAQMAGWRMEYCFDLTCPAELPNTAKALKGQQRRWSTGAMQTGRKLLPTILSSRSRLSLTQRLEATFHLSHHTTAVWILLLALIARPMFILLVEKHPLFQNWFWGVLVAIIATTVAPLAVYGYARFALGGGWSGFWAIPHLLAMGMGLCVNNTLAVIRGCFLKGGEFVRTPKTGSQGNRRQRSSYKPVQDSLWLIELILGVYMTTSLVFYVSHFHSVFSIFLLLYAIGFTAIGWESSPFHRPRRRDTNETPLDHPQQTQADEAEPVITTV